MRHTTTIPIAPDHANILTMRDVIAFVQAATDLPANRKMQMLSAVRTLCRVFSLDPVDVPADPTWLRGRMETVSCAAAKLTIARWTNIRSLTAAALNTSGLGVIRNRTKDEALPPAWEILWKKLPEDRRLQCGLSRFVNYCATSNITPNRVTTKTFVTFNDKLVASSLVRNIQTVYRTACVCWNDAVESIPGWPRTVVEVPSSSLRYSLAWEEFPDSFKADVEAYLNRTVNQDPFAEDYAKPVAEATTINRRKQIQLLATALAKQGFPASEIIGIATLVNPANAAKALEFFYNRAEKKKTENVYNLAILLKTMARHWVKSDAQDIKRIEELCGRLAIKSYRMTDKNRTLLRQFDNPANIGDLLGLPRRLLREAAVIDDGGSHCAMRVMYAVAISLLTVSAIRLKNLTFLEIDRHIVRQRIGSNSVVHLVIPGHEVKNGEPIERELPESTVALLDLYLKKFRPRLISAPSRFLFPGAQGKARNPTSFSRRIGEIILIDTGLKMHVHLFRQTAVKFHLDAHPEDLETARMLLGHKSLKTTMRSYAERKPAAAFKRYDGVLADLADKARLSTSRSKKVART